MSKDTKKGTHNNKAGQNGRRLIELDISTIYFTHARVSEQFTGCNKRIQDTLEEFVRGETTLADIPFITVIENFEPVIVDDGKTKKNGGAPQQKKANNKRSARKNAGASDDEDDTNWMAEFDNVKTELKPFYFSLNNRRLFLFKNLYQLGLVKTITAQVKPALDREKVKYTRARCSLSAKLMSGKKMKLDVNGNEVSDHGSDDDDSDDNNDVGADDNKDIKNKKENNNNDNKESVVNKKSDQEKPENTTTTTTTAQPEENNKTQKPKPKPKPKKKQNDEPDIKWWAVSEWIISDSCNMFCISLVLMMLNILLILTNNQKERTPGMTTATATTMTTATMITTTIDNFAEASTSANWSECKISHQQ